MPLSDGSYPFVEGGKTFIMDPATGERYDVDGQGNALTPAGPEVPFWGQPPQAPKGTGGTYGTSPGYDPVTGKFAGQPTPPKTLTPSPTPPSPTIPGGQDLPALNVQPGLGQQNWEATYNLSLAQEKRLRELMETVTQPQARAAIDQAIQAIKQQGFGNQKGIWESQAAMTGKVPQWLPKSPNFQPGGWQSYQTGGMVSPPGGQPSAPAGEAVYDTVNGPKTIPEMESELKVANWPGGEDVPTAYARTTGGPVTPRR